MNHDNSSASPPLPETLDAYVVRYPPGDWYDFWTGKKMPPQPFGADVVGGVALVPFVHARKATLHANELSAIGVALLIEPVGVDESRRVLFGVRQNRAIERDGFGMSL